MSHICVASFGMVCSNNNTKTIKFDVMSIKRSTIEQNIIIRCVELCFSRLTIFNKNYLFLKNKNKFSGQRNVFYFNLKRRIYDKHTYYMYYI